MFMYSAKFFMEGIICCDISLSQRQSSPSGLPGFTKALNAPWLSNRISYSLQSWWKYCPWLLSRGWNFAQF